MHKKTSKYQTTLENKNQIVSMEMKESNALPYFGGGRSAKEIAKGSENEVIKELKKKRLFVE